MNDKSQSGNNETDDASLSFTIEPVAGGPGPMGNRGERAAVTQAALDRARQSVIEIGASFSDVLETMPVKVEHLDLKFGLKLEGAAGVWLARVGTQASFEVSLRIKAKGEND